MAKKQTMEPAPGEQMDLIDVGPENLKQIKPIAKEYRAAVKARMAAGETEKDLKEQLLAMVKDANLTRLDDGTIRFKVDGMLITVTPRDELIRVKEDDDE